MASGGGFDHSLRVVQNGYFSLRSTTRVGFFFLSFVWHLDLPLEVAVSIHLWLGKPWSLLGFGGLCWVVRLVCFRMPTFHALNLSCLCSVCFGLLFDMSFVKGNAEWGD